MPGFHHLLEIADISAVERFGPPGNQASWCMYSAIAKCAVDAAKVYAAIGQKCGSHAASRNAKPRRWTSERESSADVNVLAGRRS